MKLHTLHYALDVRDGNRPSVKVISQHDSRAYEHGSALLTDSVLSVLVEAEQAGTLAEHRDITRRLSAMLRDNWELRKEFRP